ncbi:hypothetical protein [Oceanicaulis alexandrii]|uniref:hypothetical protein n=1 Tax=Oceanicaulis alexandrii TaxID=153233 RepID=UPI0003B3DC1D|nr:hypothetical protein [Oceanicaulis alexandrii]
MAVTPAAKTYMRRMLVIFTLYTVLLFGAVWTDNQFDLAQPVRIILSLLPVLPVIACIGTIMAFVRAMDEVQARIVLESALIGAILVAVASFTYGMLRGVTDWPGILEVWYLPAFIGVSGFAQIFVKRRYQ